VAGAGGQSIRGRSRQSLYRPFACTVEQVRELTGSEKLFRLRRDDGHPFGHLPGQFVQVSIFGIGEAPISVCSSPTRGDYLELTVRRTGRLTEAMHRLSRGDTLGMRGPFGSSFDLEAMRGQDLLLVAGGLGMAPMRALVQYCEDRRDQFGRVIILYGARAPGELLYADEVDRWRRSDAFTCYCTVDQVPEGERWDGPVGVVTKLIPPLELAPERTVAVVVGPPVMYRFVIAALFEKGLRQEQIVVSLERHMKCGVGKCGHCAIEHLYCCLDGPVFRLDRISGIRGALE